MGHVRDRWTNVGESGRKVRNDRWGRGQRWQARWVEHGRERSQAFASKDAAEAHIAARLVQGDTPAPPDRTLTFREYGETWRAQQLQHRESTVRATRTRFDSSLYPLLGDLPLARVTRGDVQAAVSVMAETLAPSTVHVGYGFIASVFKSAVMDGLVPATPCLRISLPPKPQRRVVPLTSEQVVKIAGRVPAWYRSMVVVGAATGLRSGELRGLTADRVQGSVVTVDRQLVGVQDRRPAFGPPKSSAGYRAVDMGQAATAALTEHLERFGPGVDGLVWQTRQCGPVTRGDVGEVWRAAAMGMRLRPRSGWHDLRHYHASLLIAAGLSPRAVADRLGHADVAETLRTYSHLWPTDQSRSVAAVDAALGVLIGPSVTVPTVTERAS